MQNAADAAALEGLRKRDVGLRTPAGQFVNDPFASDCLRRAAANRMVRRTFDDDFEPANGDPYQFGAGPIVGLTDGATTLHAGQTISVPEPRVYKPDPQLNQQNQVYGDMVSGRFCYTADPVPSEGGQYEVQDIVCTEEQRGSGIYARNDFNPSLTVPTPPAALSECPAPDDEVPTPWPVGGSGSLSTVNDSAFLVRSAPLERVCGRRRPGGAERRVERTVAAAHLRQRHDDLRRRSQRRVFGSPRRAHRTRDGDRIGAARHARGSAAQQPRAAGRDAVCPGRHLRAVADGRSGHADGVDQPGDRRHDAHGRRHAGVPDQRHRRQVRCQRRRRSARSDR